MVFMVQGPCLRHHLHTVSAALKAYGQAGKACYTASEKEWALPNLFTRVYTRLEVVWVSSTKYCKAKPLRCRYTRVNSRRLLGFTPGFPVVKYDILSSCFRFCEVVSHCL